MLPKIRHNLRTCGCIIISFTKLLSQYYIAKASGSSLVFELYANNSCSADFEAIVRKTRSGAGEGTVITVISSVKERSDVSRLPENIHVKKAKARQKTFRRLSRFCVCDAVRSLALNK